MKTGAAASQDAEDGNTVGGNEERMVRGSMGGAKESSVAGAVLGDMVLSAVLADTDAAASIAALVKGEGDCSMPAT